METSTKSARGKKKPISAASMVSSLLGNAFRPSDDDPLPSGPWDPVVRSIFEFGTAFGPTPYPWHTHFDAHNRADLAALNPQPLPPRAMMVTILGRAALGRAELISDLAGRGDQSGRGGAYLMELLDDWCGTGPKRFPWPRPRPRPFWAEEEIGALDHLILASTLEHALASGIGGELGKAIEAGHNLLVQTASKTMSG